MERESKTWVKEIKVDRKIGRVANLMHECLFFGCNSMG